MTLMLVEYLLMKMTRTTPITHIRYEKKLESV